MNLTSKLKKDLKWVTIAQIIQQVIKICLWIVLARLVLPEAFGLLAMSVAFTTLPQLIIDQGLPNSIVQKKDIKLIEINSSYWASLGMGLVLFLIYFFGAVFIADFFGEESLEPIIQAISFIFIISSIGEISHGLLKRNLRFDQIVKSQLGGFFIGAVVAIIAAINGLQVWSLVLQVLVSNAITYILFFYYCNNKPNIDFDFKVLKDFGDFGFKVLVYRLLTYLMRYLDDILIGYFFGKTKLGYYDRSYLFVHLPMRIFSNRVNQVLFSSYVGMEKEKIKKNQLQVFELLGLILFPFLFGVFLFSENFVELFLGENWLPIVPLLKILVVGGIFHAFNNLNEVILLAEGKAGLQIRIGLVTRFLIVFGYIIGLQWGMVGVCIGYSIASLVGFFFESRFSWRIVEITFFDFIEQIWKSGLSCLIIFIIFKLCLLYFLIDLDSIGTFLIGILIFSLLYLISLRTFLLSNIERISSPFG